VNTAKAEYLTVSENRAKAEVERKYREIGQKPKLREAVRIEKISSGADEDRKR
jgi:ribosomal protein L20A (L18A)